MRGAVAARRIYLEDKVIKNRIRRSSLVAKVALVCCLASLLGSCNEDFYPPEGMCDETSNQSVRLADATPLGFTGAELLQKVEGTSEAVFRYESGDTTKLALSVARKDEKVNLVQHHYYGDRSRDSECGQGKMEVALDVQLSTADGAFSEHFAAVGSAASLRSITWMAEIDLASLGGTWRPKDLDPSAYDTVKVVVSGAVAATKTGEVSLFTTKADSNAQTGSSQPIASW